jgi:hypothetical protein
LAGVAGRRLGSAEAWILDAACGCRIAGLSTKKKELIIYQLFCNFTKKERSPQIHIDLQHIFDISQIYHESKRLSTGQRTVEKNCFRYWQYSFVSLWATLLLPMLRHAVHLFE